MSSTRTFVVEHWGSWPRVTSGPFASLREAEDFSVLVVASGGRFCVVPNTARSVHTGFPMSDEQQRASARRARNVHARSVYCRRAAMYVHPGDHSRRFGPERER